MLHCIRILQAVVLHASYIYNMQVKSVCTCMSVFACMHVCVCVCVCALCVCVCVCLCVCVCVCVCVLECVSVPYSNIWYTIL